MKVINMMPNYPKEINWFLQGRLYVRDVRYKIFIFRIKNSGAAMRPEFFNLNQTNYYSKIQLCILKIQ